jgi:hypothetical protein
VCCHAGLDIYGLDQALVHHVAGQVHPALVPDVLLGGHCELVALQR